MPSTGGNAGESCANCGGPGDHVEEVRRVYVTVDADGRVVRSETVEAVEEWCVSCRTLYPHQPAGDPPAAGRSS